MRIEKLPNPVADPCCGSGAILDVLREGGHIVHGSDVVNYGWPYTVIRDYLAEPIVMNDVAIVSNPPYRLAEAFIRKAIADDCRYHAWLLRLNFLESVGRMPLWRDHPPSRLWVSSGCLPMMHRLGWNGPKSTSNQAYGWFVWDDSAETGSGDFRASPGWRSDQARLARVLRSPAAITCRDVQMLMRHGWRGQALGQD